MSDEDVSDETVGPSVRSKVVGSLTLPLFFVVMFAICYVSAFHAPKPNGVEVELVGPSQQTARLASALASDGFEVHTATSDADVEQQVLDRDRAGAIVLGRQIDVYTATGGGVSVRSSILAAARDLGARTDLPVREHDLAPVAAKDSAGTVLFYFLIISTIAGYLTIIVLFQAVPELSLRARFAILGAAAVVAPVLTVAVSSIFVGMLGASFGATVAMVGVLIVYIATIGTLSIAATQAAGQAATALILLLTIFLNFPSAGGAIPVGMLPGFWQSMHAFWFGSAAFEPIRDIVYFGGRNAWDWLWRLGVWLVAALALTLVLELRKRIETPVGRHEADTANATVGMAI